MRVSKPKVSLDCSNNNMFVLNLYQIWVKYFIANVPGLNSSLVDNDECTLGTDNCHNTLATCTNKPGSFVCKCKAGFNGDGVNCTGTYELTLSQISIDRNFSVN